ncbi:TonB-dependent receptor [Chitiniphilus shinanonensis]|uniref:TonB-dependent receptor n=1 Tax=Chitiniphilus shinanonensis TaxID=553088 RepID=A0ABQ6BXL1_9NEIS|nr:TonB-dependent siderophore receptor [Chitiniphilus shinanonensis]GLS06152.1 TonB-dependent receptor [Chitiniphilus shinanonensis]
MTHPARPFRLLRLKPLARAVRLAPLVLAPTLATAAPDTAEVTLPTVTVTAPAESPTGPVQGYVARRSATATKTDTPLIETPQSISVVGRDEIEDRGATTLLEAIRYTPGVTVSNWGYDIRGYDWLLIRGFNAQSTSSFRDGLRQSGLGYVEPITEVYGLERVEVLRGPASVMFGRGDAGGVVNRVSKTPSLDAPREVEVQLGSFERRQIAADFGGALTADNSVLYRIVALGLDSNSQEEYPNGDDTYQKRLYLAPSLRWDVSPDTSITLLAEVLRNDASDDINYITGPDGGLTHVKEGDPDYSQIKINSATFGYQFEHDFNEAWQFRQNLRYANRDADKHHIKSSLDSDGRTLLRTAWHEDEDLDQWTIDTNVQGHVQTGPVIHTLLFGFDWDHMSGDAVSSYSNNTPSLDILDPIYRQSIPEPDQVAADGTRTIRQLGFYAQDQIRFNEQWLLTAGGRWDKVKLDYDDHLGNNSASQSDSAFTGRLGLTYLAPNGVAPYISYAQSFLPNFIDEYGTLFDPSRAEQIEAGVKIQPNGANWMVTGAVYSLTKRDVVTYDDADSWTAKQTGKIRSRGVELEGKAQLTPRLKGIVSYTFTDAEVLESSYSYEVGKTPMQVPRQQAALWLDYTVPTGIGAVGLGGGLRYVGERWDDAENTSREGGYTLADLAVRWQRGPWSVAFNVNNLFDKEYFASRTYGNYQLGEERSYTVTGKYRF